MHDVCWPWHVVGYVRPVTARPLHVLGCALPAARRLNASTQLVSVILSGARYAFHNFCSMLSATRCLLHVVCCASMRHVVRCVLYAAWCLLHAFGRLTSPASFLLHVVRCTLSSLVCLRCVLFAARCLLRGFCHTLSAARCLLRVDAARCALRVVCCMVSAARFRPPHVPRIVSAACCPLHAVFPGLPSVCVVRRMLRAGCCPLHDACCTLSAAACGLRRMFVCCCTYCRRALRRAMRCGVGQSGACCTVPPLGETAALRIACRPDRTWGTTPRSTVAVLSVAIVAWQAATAGGVSRTAHVPSRTFKPTALSHVPCCRCARLHFACRRQTLETPSPRFREGSRHTTATSTATLPAHSLCSPHVPMPPHFQC